MPKSVPKSKKQPNAFSKLFIKATASRRAVFVTALLGIAVFGGIGSYLVNSSSAAVPAVTKDNCFTYLGRNWKNGSCSKTCSSYAGSLVVADPYDYCSKAASNIDKATCDNKKRQFVYGVCLKEWNRQFGADGYTIACKPQSLTYYIADPYDYCK